MEIGVATDLSPFLKQLIARHPEWLAELQQSGRLDSDSRPNADQLLSTTREDGFEPGLRAFRNREMLRVIWRDLNRLATLEETMADLSTMAELCLQSATHHFTRRLEKQHGTPRSTSGEAQRLVVIGLGKLGGCELNMSSDIDILFCYPASGVCDGRGGLSNEQFFSRLARKVIRSLSEVTADGFCFRVDTRLRPFGESGPLVSSFSALEQYYQREGRNWERYALIKGRPVAGDLAAGQQLLDLLKPFVYRRYIDFGAIEAMRDMHQNVQDDAMRRNRLDDIKRGPGGIREIEFLVQGFQLLRGGREPGLQTTSLLAAANTIKTLQLLPSSDVEDLQAAYEFLRNLENRIQALHDQQTHLVPDGEDGLRVARAMGFESMVDFNAGVDDTRTKVRNLFDQSLPQTPGPVGEKSPWQRHWQNVRRDVQAGSEERIAGDPLIAFANRLSRLSLSQRASRRLDQFMPLLLQRIDSLAPGDVVFQRVLDLISAICQRSAYLSLLVQNPAATDQMLSLFTTSKRVADTVTRYPALLDELIDPQLGAQPPVEDDIKKEVDRILRNHKETESTLQGLNYFKQAMSLRISVGVLRSTLSVHESRALLSLLAQHLIQAALGLSLEEVAVRHGMLPGPKLAVIAYGSLGACSLGFDSDLDLVFLYEPVDAQSDGTRPVFAEHYHTAVARRLLSLLSATTPAGRLYNIDARLRPNGRAGLLLSSVAAFKRYQQEKAWVWELQALTRARPVAGSERVWVAFASTRTQVLIAAHKNESVARDVSAMRERVRDEQEDSDPLKYGRGGLLDIEFVVQLGLLLKAGEFPEIVASTKIRAQLQALGACSWLSADALKSLGLAYDQLSHARQQQTLTDDHPEEQISKMLKIAKPVCSDVLG